MEGAGGLDNPAFVPSSPGPRRHLPASLAEVEVSVFSGPGEELPLPQPLAQPPPAQPPELEEGPCGCGRFTPQCLQRCNNPKGFLFHYCLLALTQGIVVNGLVNISISTVEKRYELKSSLTGLVSSSYDISFCLLSLFVSFFGERGHKPRWLAFASFMMGLGSLIFSLPHFTSGEYHFGSKFEGIGFSMSVLGPAIGYVLGGQLLKIYIDADMGKRAFINEDDPRWLGAWWIGFILSWFLAWSLILPFSCFPKHLPGTAEIQAGKISQAHQNESDTKTTDKNFGKSIKDFPASLKILLRNPVFMCLAMSTATEALISTGFATFLSKYIENQFGLSSSFAATLGGVVLIPGAALGQILGGVIVSKFKMACKNIMKFSLLMSLLSLVLSFIFLFAKCGNEPFAGVSEAYNGTGELGNLTAPCNVNCNCLGSFYFPVCGRDGVQYFSPCIAGCKNSVPNSQPKTYNNCSCIGRTKQMMSSAESLSFEAKAGKCGTHCTNLPLFLGFFFVTIVFTFMAGTPVTVAILRCVNNQQRSLALGVQFVLVRLLGTIPGPIVFGFAIDNSCSLWDINECGIRGACWLYDNARMAFMLVGISVGCKALTILFNILAIFLYKPPPSGTHVTFQSENVVVASVPVEPDHSKTRHDG
uniref:Solute carrier organic anion transporter family member n=1 Tax=Phascolarctos cinereus TaxID=38626 RepID=A0A6P5M8Z5_PHACI|nr:solute carrier organic anion transporter family member 4C1-like isoform X2 [Phascolarctos cinereus]